MVYSLDDLWQSFDELGKPIVGKSVTRMQASKGVLQGAAHVWIWRQRGAEMEILLQERAKDKPTWPGFFDISAAGHIDFGETPLQAALRESEEELGLQVSADDLRLMFVHRQHSIQASDDVIENQFQWV